MMVRNRLAVAIVLTFFVTGLPGCGDDTPPPSAGPVDKAKPTRYEGRVFFTDSWAGEWNIVITFRDCNTDQITMVEDVVGLVCPGDTLQFSFTNLFSDCDGQITNNQLDAACDYFYLHGECGVRVTFAMNLEREDGMVSGGGVWAATTSVPCADTQGTGCETMEITGVRLSPDCEGPRRLTEMLTFRPAALSRAVGGGH